MIIELDNRKIRVEPSDWRWSATIVGLVKYFDFHSIKYDKSDDYIEFDSKEIDDVKYLMFAEEHFKDSMHHKFVEDIIKVNKPSEEQIKLVNDKLSKNTSSNTIMLKLFKGKKYDGTNSQEIESIIDENRLELIKLTYKGGRSLYYNFCNENNLLAEKGKSCRLRGYSNDMGKKSKSVSYMRDKNTFVYEDSKLFDFIPFAFSKTNSKIREAFFVNNNFTIDQLLKTNKNDSIKEDFTARSKLFFKVKDSSSFIDYDVEVIKKEREKDYFESIYIRKDAIKIFEIIRNETLEILTKPCNIKRSDKGQDIWLNIEKKVIDCILNFLKLDDVIDQLLKGFNNHKFLIKNLIEINKFIYGGDSNMNEKQKRAYGAAMEAKGVLKGKENKIRAYEQRLISAITLKDYDRVQEILLHLSAFTQVKMDFLIDVFEDFEANKNLAYTFINVFGEKKKKENTEGDKNAK
ncbi:MAG: type I CRISPR-associated protein Cas8a1/Csx8 [Candidatus Delongbacteria bacterium]|jgi:CRISPR-associated protein Cst1|nr:type I CRISPR-associated protein Cas8a1/Csx8 [Candidatus Delongbacteria bacterium]